MRAPRWGKCWLLLLRGLEKSFATEYALARSSGPRHAMMRGPRLSWPRMATAVGETLMIVGGNGVVERESKIKEEDVCCGG